MLNMTNVMFGIRGQHLRISPLTGYVLCRVVGHRASPCAMRFRPYRAMVYTGSWVTGFTLCYRISPLTLVSYFKSYSSKYPCAMVSRPFIAW